jgi:hypothetical protein
MRTIFVVAAAISALSVAGCHPKALKHTSDWSNISMNEHDSSTDDNAPPLKTVASLTCPTSAGDLTRTAQAPDGKSCDYTGPNDEVVHLSLVDLAGRSALDALAPKKSELDGLVHVSADNGPVSVNASKDANGDHAKVDLPFLHVDADGDNAKVKLFGVNIDAKGDHATVHTGFGTKNAVVHAGPGGAQVVAEDVGKTNAALVYILASDTPGPSGYRAVGYLAKGPVAGPLVVAEFKAKGGGHGGSHHDLDTLIDLNVKG